MGTERKTLLCLYKLDYGSSVYSSAAASHFRRLDPLQSEGLRLPTGAFRSTPIFILHAETNVPPHSLRRRLTNCKDYGAHVYCTASPRALRIWDPVQNEALRLATGAFRSSIPSFHVETKVLPLDLHRESLPVKALLRPYLLPSSLL